MGELVVADSVVNADEYDEAHFATVAYDVAKVAAETVDRTARKAWRDNGGATGAGYLDISTNRNFGYGEWAARGGYGALCNWAVANSLLPAEPDAGRDVYVAFTHRLGMQPWALSLPDKELCLREALAVCTAPAPAPEPSAKRPGS